MVRRTGRFSRTILAVAMVSAGAMAAASQAGATVTIGQTFLASFMCGGPSTYFEQSTAPGSPSYAVPAGGGTITSWSVQTGPSGAHVKLAVLRNAGGPSTFTTVSTSAEGVLAASTLNTFSTSLPVQADDRIGVLITSSSSFPYGCANPGFDPLDIGQRDAAVVHDTGTFSYIDPSDHTRVNLSATVEPAPSGTPTQGQPAATKKCKKKKHKSGAQVAEKKCKKKKKK